MSNAPLSTDQKSFSAKAEAILQEEIGSIDLWSPHCHALRHLAEDADKDIKRLQADCDKWAAAMANAATAARKAIEDRNLIQEQMLSVMRAIHPAGPTHAHEDDCPLCGLIVVLERQQAGVSDVER